MRISPLPPLQYLVAFEAAFRHLSFTKAAAELHLTQSAISRQIQHLEAFLGRALFVREHRALKTTIAGEEFAQQVQWLLSRCAEATLAVMKRDTSLDLTVACSSGVAALWLTPRLPQFRAAHPHINLRVIVRDGLHSVLPSEFDIGIYFAREQPGAHYASQRFFDEEVMPVCSPRYLGGRLVTPAELANETLLILEDGQRQWMSWPEWLGLHGVALPKERQAIMFNHYPQLIHMALLDQGVVLAWRHIIDAYLERGLLVRATRETGTQGGAYYLLWPVDRSQSKAAQTFRRWALAQGAHPQAAAEDPVFPRA